MSCIRWFFMSKYKKLLCHIKVAQKNKQRLHVADDIILDFTYEGRVDATNQEIIRLSRENAKLRRMVLGLAARIRRLRLQK